MSPQTYQQMVEAFSTGVLALVVGDKKRAQDQLVRASQIVPKEPATWGNLAVLDFGTDLDGAEHALQQAQSLSPPNSQIELLAGLIASRRGKPDEALDHFRKAIALDGGNLIARYSLVEELGRQPPGPQSDAEAQRQLEQIVAVQPGNVVALLDLTREAARAGNTGAVRRWLAPLQALSDAWPPETKQRLQALSRSAQSANPSDLVTQIAVLHNVLEQTPSFQASYAALHVPRDLQAEPIRRFIRLPPPHPTPAPPDMGLTFAAQPLGTARVAWARALMLAPAPAPETGEPPAADGPPTLAMATGGSLVLDTNGTKTTLPLPGPAAPAGVLPIDWNNDYRPDLALAGPGGLRLFQQGSPGHWTDVTARSHLPAAITGGAYTGAWAVDIDLDGDLDIVLGSKAGPPRVLRNNADGTWTPIQPFPGAGEPRLGRGSGQRRGPGPGGIRDLVWADLDGDGTGDIALIDGQGKLVVFRNERGGHYRSLPLPADLGKVEALSVADVDRDGVLDLVLLTAGGSIRRLSYRNPGTGPPPPPGAESAAALWEEAELARWEGAPADGSARLIWADLDNNGALDLIASGRGGSRIWLGGAGGTLTPLAAPIDARVLSVADLDGDGRLDLVGVSKAGTPVRLMNRGTKSYRWEVLRPRNDKGVQPSSSGNSKFNSFGIGGEAELWAGLVGEKQPITGPSLHYGMGDQNAINFFRVIWPSGQIQGEFDLKSEQAEIAKQRLTSSCPWLFADDGTGMRFVTDILWKSPLGLRINAQAGGPRFGREADSGPPARTSGAVGTLGRAPGAGVSQTRDWVKIRGDQLQPRDGFYNLSITAELWETDYFDKVSLMTVDHPRGTEVMVDERFAIPQPPLALHALSPPQPVAHAWDDHGRDVTDLVRARDGRYLAGFALGPYQGIARDHYVEVELPAAGVRGQGSGVRGQGRAGTDPRPLTPNPRLYLVASGWVFPTDSSINVAISQGHHDQPRSLSLEVPDARGRWVTARSNLGFPAGKNKTILIDLTGVFPPGSPTPHRLRLRTNMEIYWDSLAVAPALPVSPLRTREIAPAVAELRYRGFSAIHRAARSSPELPDYQDLAGTEQQWLDLTGFYTRFGDVRELLSQVDDRYVIMNAGDEIRLRFPAPPPPPPGWTRDFVFVSDGWDKDGNFNTGFSETVLPLPSHDQPDYRRPLGRLEDDPVYRRHPHDWQEYHTRYITPRAVRTALWELGR